MYQNHPSVEKNDRVQFEWVYLPPSQGCGQEERERNVGGRGLLKMPKATGRIMLSNVFCVNYYEFK